MLGLSLIVGYVISLIVCAGAFFNGVVDPNDNCVVWFTVFGPWVTITYLAGLWSDPRAFCPFPNPEGDRGIWTVFMIQGILIPVMALLCYGMPEEGVFTLVQIWMGWNATIGFLFVIVGVGGYVMNRLRRA